VGVCRTCSCWTLSGSVWDGAVQGNVVGRVVGGRCQAQCAWQRPPTTRPTTFHVWRTRGCQCSFRLLMMDGVSLKTSWVLYKYRIIKILIRCCILLNFFFMNILYSYARLTGPIRSVLGP
jgi:hypothetical protein